MTWKTGSGISYREKVRSVGAVSASDIYRMQESPQNPAPNVDDIRNRIANILKKPGCAEFIKNLINGTATNKNPAEGTNALDLFNKIAGQGGLVYGDTIKKAYGIDGATVHGLISTNNAQIEFSTPHSVPIGISRRGLTEYMNDQSRIRAKEALHETLHLAGKNGWYDDFAFANTLAAMRGVTPPKFANIVEASNYWNNTGLAKACF